MLARTGWTAPQIDKPHRLNDRGRRMLAESVAEIMKEAMDRGAPSKFAMEAPIRHALRARLCLQGKAWPVADAIAADVVSRALAMIGAVRPTWPEGQPDFVQLGAGAHIERTRCVRCHKPLPGEHTKFCGTLCATANHMRLARLHQFNDQRAYDTAARLP
ncbi:hypothetical protein [Acuticoccus sp. I52.16.1]|uniref:hypothetical protein n=1 Tax=Acuticoccus sp. I52.16.1 TaxID=2928472 RepID=UPI001FD1A006|nr:hypothetical protein [Acuticoccus sp. I52.16.1]UOM34857.1 hypothetical protein MRB58_01200 [Acuticoccus sp. I52.16.1]